MADIGDTVNSAMDSDSGKPLGEKGVLTGVVAEMATQDREEFREYLEEKFPGVFSRIKDKYFPFVFYNLLPDAEREVVRQHLQGKFPGLYEKYDAKRIGSGLPCVQLDMTDRGNWEYML